MEVSESSFILNTHDLTSDTVNTIQEGGCFSSYSCSDINNVMLKAFTSKRPDVVCFLLENLKTKIDKLDMKDKHDRNFLHYFILYNNYEIIDDYVTAILKNKSICSVRDAINAQDVLGNTPLHYAVMINNDKLINLLIERGANKKIKNNEGTFVDTEDQLHDLTQTYNRQSAREDSIKRVDLEADTDDGTEVDIFISDKDNLKHMLDILPNKNVPDTESFVYNPSTRNTVITDVATDDIAKAIIEKMRGGVEDKFPSIELTVPPRSPEPESLVALDDESVNTAVIIRELQKKNSETQHGGKKSKSKSKGKRKLITYSEFSFGNDLINEGAFGDPIKTDEDFTEATEKIGLELLKLNKEKLESEKENSEKENTESDKTLEKKLFDDTEDIEKTEEKTEDTVTPKKDEKSEDTIEVQSELSEMARSIARQSTEIHERVIKKIAELLKLNLENPEDNKKVRYYKAAIWRQITTKHPELSNFDRAVEMEKMVTKEFLKTIDIDKVTKELDKYFSEKEESKKDKKKEKKDEKKKEEKKLERSKNKKKKDKKEKKKSKKSKSMSGGSIDSMSLSISTESNLVYSSTSEF